ncbi:cytochrome P450 2F2-like [Clarias gariepinus]|uniref:cytochrome P450 2F2-like n=1 Tax=Clarias gariepinus TaxID=13013 RepID=UPI00234C320A|nr:cytochrome P450 2F2-like [Clarias gariepinus]
MLGSLIFVGICIFLFFFLIRIQKPKNFPPGPRPLPMVGNLLHFNINNPLKDFELLAERYGNVYSLYLGRSPAVVLNGLNAIKEALVTKYADFSGRPQNLLISHMMEGKGVALADYGPAWKEHRRFALMTLRNFGMGKQSMENRILGEIEHLVAKLEKHVGSVLHPQTLFHDAASNIIYLMLSGTRYEYGEETLNKSVKWITEITKILNGPWSLIYDTLPWTRSLPLPFMKLFKNNNLLKEMTMTMIKNHKTTRVRGEPRDFVDCYLDDLDMVCLCGSTFNEDQLVMYILNLHMAGTDTTSNTLLTAFLYLMAYCDSQGLHFTLLNFICKYETDGVLHGKFHVSFEDRNNMPDTQAVIHESQCIASFGPLSVFHPTTRDTELMGYSISKLGTNIIPNLSSVLNEEGQWKFPHEFNPSNFLNGEGQFEKPEAFIPFSAGPRLCLGEGLARMELFLIFVSLLHRFQFIWPKDARDPDFTPVFGITLTPKPYKMGIRLRQTAREI